MFLILDHYDSFVYNLTGYLQELGEEVLVLAAENVTIEEIKAINPKAILISPGPKRPEDAVHSQNIVKAFYQKIPILGICLGHQIINTAFGGKTEKGKQPVHGRVSSIYHSGKGLFSGLPSPYEVTRYHSLTVNPQCLPPNFIIDATTACGTIMALSHKTYPLYSTQFHPEAILTQWGHALLKNFIRLTEEWWYNNESNNQTTSTLPRCQ